MCASPLRNYMANAPFPLAFERAVEAALYAGRRLEHPILDIGCGEGLFARMVFDQKIDTGLDPNARELHRARQYGAYGELILCRGDAIPRPAGSYQTILSNSVLEHIPDLEPVFREAHRLSRAAADSTRRFRRTISTASRLCTGCWRGWG